MALYEFLGRLDAWEPEIEAHELTDDERSQRAVERFLTSVEECQRAEGGSPAERDSVALLHISDIMQRQPAEWLVKNLLPRRGVATIYGPSMAGKSFLAFDLAAKISSGEPWFSHRVTRAPVVYLCLEGAAGFSSRVNAYAMESGSLGDMRFFDGEFCLNSQVDVDALASAINGAGLLGAAIMVDTFAQATSGSDENSSSEMTSALSSCKRLAAAVDGLVVLIHHTGKDLSRGLRGHSSMLAAMDGAIEVSGGNDGEPRTWAARKVKDGEAGKVHQFELQRVALGVDADGDEITSCIVAPLEPTAETVRRAKVPTGGNQRIIWDGIGELLRVSPCAPAGAPSELPPGRPAVRLENAVAKLRERLTCDNERKTERTRAAITGLINRGLLQLREGFLWCT